MKVLPGGLGSMMGNVSAALVLATMVACGGATPAANTPDGASSGESSELVGKPAPEVVGEYVAGDGPKTLAEAKGKVTIVDFWGTFCEPCKKSFPKLQEMVDTQAGNLFVIAVSQDDGEETKPEDIKKFAEELKVSFPIVWDKEKKTAGSYHPPKMPTTYIIDKNGVVRHVHGGYTEGEDEKLQKEVEALVAE